MRIYNKSKKTFFKSRTSVRLLFRKRLTRSVIYVHTFIQTFMLAIMYFLTYILHVYIHVCLY